LESERKGPRSKVVELEESGVREEGMPFRRMERVGEKPSVRNCRRHSVESALYMKREVLREPYSLGRGETNVGTNSDGLKSDQKKTREGTRVVEDQQDDFSEGGFQKETAPTLKGGGAQKERIVTKYATG